MREALAEVVSRLESAGFELDLVSTVELVLAEVLNNIIEHAYPPSGPQGPIEIRCKGMPDGLHFNVMDMGLAMPDGQLPTGNSQELDVDIEDLPEGGFGWFLIKDLAQDVIYQRVREENHLSLRIQTVVH
ncbi:MAG: ATP-binding protein [Sulfitobacter sp.]